MIIVVLICLVLIGFLIYFLVAVIKGTIQGVKRVQKIDNLQKNADVSITSKNGEFVFKYASKLYMSEKKVLIIIVPEIPLSAWKANMTYDNQGLSATVKIKSKDFDDVETKTFKLTGLEQRLEINLDDNMLNQILEIKIDSKWLFADEHIDDHISMTLGE